MFDQETVHQYFSSISVALLGGRQHYAVPRAFHKKGALAALFTDYWVGKRTSAWLRRLPWKAAARLAGRSHPDLPGKLVHVVSEPTRLHMMRRVGLDRESLYDFYCREGRLFAKGVNRLYRRYFDSQVAHKAYFGFTSTSLETLQLFAEAGGVTILDQIDPLCVEHRIIQEEREKWPGWEPDKEQPNNAYIERVQAEWRLATHVLVNSEWTAQALIEQGVPRGKIMVIPQAYEGPVGELKTEDHFDGRRPLRVLWLGSVILRKGIPYLIEAAKALGSAVEIRVVGPIGIAQEIVATAPENMSFWGQVPRIHCESHWQWADLFVLPTLSDGFAITQLEAMAYGLPVLVTPNCGEVVEHGINGLIVGPGDAESLTQAILTLARNPQELAEMSRHARETVQQFTLDHYAERVLAGLGWLPNQEKEFTG